MTKESTKMLNAILPDIEETYQLLDEIANSSREQETGAEQVNSALQQLSRVTQQNASSSEEMASSAEEMASQAQELEQITQYFKVDNVRGDFKDGDFIEKNLANSIQVNEYLRETPEMTFNFLE